MDINLQKIIKKREWSGRIRYFVFILQSTTKIRIKNRKNNKTEAKWDRENKKVSKLIYFLNNNNKEETRKKERSLVT